MRTMKKTIAFVLAFAMAFATAFSAIGAKVTASAEGEFTITSFGSGGGFEFAGANKEAQVAVTSVKNGKVAAIKSWDTYKGASGYGSITINPKKDVYVAFRTVSSDGVSYTDPIFYAVTKNNAKYKAKVEVSGDAYKVSLTAGGADYKGEVESDLIFENGVALVDDEETLNTGITASITPTGKENVSAEATVKYNDKDCEVKGAVQADAKTINVKIKKRANAPAVSINYAKGVANIPKGCKYRLVSGDAAWESDWKTADDKVTLELTKADKGLVQVYKAEGKKAIASKIGSASFGQKALDSNDYTYTYSSADGIKVTFTTDVALEYNIGTAVGSKWTAVKDKKIELGAKKAPATSKLFVRTKADKKTMVIPGATVTIDYAASGNAQAAPSGN